MPPRKNVSSHGVLNFLSLIFFKKYFANLGLTFHSFRVPFLCVQRKQKHTTFLVVAKRNPFFVLPIFCSDNLFQAPKNRMLHHGSFESFWPFNKNGLRLKQFARNLRTSALFGKKSARPVRFRVERDLFLGGHQQTWDGFRVDFCWMRKLS